MLSKSRFNRRLHQIGDLIIDLFFQLSSLIKELNPFGHEHLVKNGKAGDLCKKQVMSREEKSNMMLSLVEEWQKSGMTQKDFARSHEVKLSRLRYWIRKSREEAEPEGFLSISLPGENSIRLFYPNGIELRMPAGTPVKVIRSLLNL